jgi:hypothetical protein
MSTEFDETFDRSLLQVRTTSVDRPLATMPSTVPRLAARLFSAADVSLRARLLDCLMRPLGTLGLAAISAGTFVRFLDARGTIDPGADPQSIARLSNHQVLELARFVEQVSPMAFRQFAEIVAGHGFGLAAFSASVLVLLVRSIHASQTESPAKASPASATEGSFSERGPVQR